MVYRWYILCSALWVQHCEVHTYSAHVCVHIRFVLYALGLWMAPQSFLCIGKGLVCLMHSSCCERCKFNMQAPA